MLAHCHTVMAYWDKVTVNLNVHSEKGLQLKHFFTSINHKQPHQSTAAFSWHYQEVTLIHRLHCQPFPLEQLSTEEVVLTKLLLSFFSITVSSTNRILLTYFVWGQLVCKTHAHISSPGAQSKTVTRISAPQGQQHCRILPLKCLFYNTRKSTMFQPQIGSLSGTEKIKPKLCAWLDTNSGIYAFFWEPTV